MFTVSKDIDFDKTVYIGVSGEIEDSGNDEDSCTLSFTFREEVEVEVESGDIDDLSSYELEELIDAISLHVDLGKVIARLSQQTVSNLEKGGVYTNLVAAVAEEGSK